MLAGLVLVANGCAVTPGDLRSASPAVVFGRSPQAQIWPGPAHVKALEFALESYAGKQTALLLGPRGCGKSAALAAFLQQAPNTVFFRIRERWDSGAALLAALADSTGLQPSGSTADDPEKRIATYLELHRSRGQTTIFAVDDAEHLPSDVWQVLHRLAAIDLGGHLPHLIIVGRPPTQANLQAAREWASTRMVVHRMAVPSQAEIGAYILHRLHAAALPANLFSDAACTLIAGFSRGSFGRVNLLCQASMLLAQRQGRPVVPEDLVIEAQATLGRINDPDGAQREAPARAAVGAVIRLAVRNDPSRLKARR